MGIEVAETEVVETEVVETVVVETEVVEPEVVETEVVETDKEIICPIEKIEEIETENENVEVVIAHQEVDIEVVENKTECTESTGEWYTDDCIQKEMACKEKEDENVEITEQINAVEEDKNTLHISAEVFNEEETILGENIEEQKEIDAEEIVTENKHDDEIPINLVEDVESASIARDDEQIENTEVNSGSSVQVESNLEAETVTLAESGLMSEEKTVENENVSESTGILDASDGIWKCQWNLPCLESKEVEVESTVTMQTPDVEEISIEETAKEIEPQFQLSKEDEELDAKNEQLDELSSFDSVNTVIQRTEDQMESLPEIESLEESLQSVVEDENECVEQTDILNVEPNENSEAGTDSLEAVAAEQEITEVDNTTQMEVESNISLPELEEVEMKADEINEKVDIAEPSSLDSLEEEKGDEVTSNIDGNKNTETAIKDILTDTVDKIPSKTEITSLENVCDSPADDLISEGGSDGCVSTDEGIAASDDDDKDSCKSGELRKEKDNAKEIVKSEIKIENLITEIDQHT